MATRKDPLSIKRISLSVISFSRAKREEQKKLFFFHRSVKKERKKEKRLSPFFTPPYLRRRCRVVGLARPPFDSFSTSTYGLHERRVSASPKHPRAYLSGLRRLNARRSETIKNRFVTTRFVLWPRNVGRPTLHTHVDGRLRRQTHVNSPKAVCRNLFPYNSRLYIYIFVMCDLSELPEISILCRDDLDMLYTSLNRVNRALFIDK